MESLWNWFYSVVEYLGLRHRSGRMLFIGLDNAGKTTLSGLLETGRFVQYKPTALATTHQLVLGNLRIVAYDLGGHVQARRTWKCYFPAVDAIVFIVDCFDRQKLPDAKNEFNALLNDEEVSDIPVLVLGNKIDRANAISEEQLKEYFEITDICTGKTDAACSLRPVEVFMCSLRNRVGYGDGFRWLASHMRTE